MSKLSTGIDILDTRLDGGFPEGSVVSLIADPVSTAELFLYDLASTRHTHYFSTAKSTETVETTLKQMGRDSSNLDVIDLYSTDEDEAELAMEHLDYVDLEENIIFDTFSDFANDYGRYEEVIDKLYTVSHQNDCISYLYMIKADDASTNFHEAKIPYLSDIVIKMISNIEGEQVENRLAITKLRGEKPPQKTIKLNIGTSIKIDTSRDIA